MGLPERSVRFDNVIASVSDVTVMKRQQQARNRGPPASNILEKKMVNLKF